MKKTLYIFFAVCIFIKTANSQQFSLNDTTITFKNQDGKVLSRDELKELTRGVFSIRKQIVDGKKVVTILPSENDQVSLQRTKLDTFRNGLLNKPVAAFHLMDINNKIWDSKALNGKVVVINFWFTECQPCIQEMPHLNDLVAANKSDSIVFIAAAPEKENQVKYFLSKFKFNYKIVAGAGNLISSMNVENFPTHVLVDKKGIVREVFIGYSDDIQNKLQQEIDRLK